MHGHFNMIILKWSYSTALRCGSFFGKNIGKSICVVMIRIIITFGNEIFPWLIWLSVLEIWSDILKICFCKKVDKPGEFFLPNTDNFLAFFIVFEWGRILESGMDK